MEVIVTWQSKKSPLLIHLGGGFLMSAAMVNTRQYKTYPSHDGFEIDIAHLTGKSIEYKRLFAFILMVKHEYKNSMVYNYSSKELSKKLNLSIYVIETYVNRAFKADLCHFSGKHLQLISLNKIQPYRSRGVVIHVTDESTIKSIVEQFNILIIKHNFASQDTLRTVKSDLIKASTPGAKINPKSYKKSKKIASKIPGIKDERLIDFNIIGMRKLSSILGCSLNYAARFIKLLVEKGIVKTEKVVKKYANCEFSRFSSEELKKSLNKKAGYFYSYLGFTFFYLGTKIEFTV